MNRTIKRCLLGLVTSVAMFGVVKAQDPGQAGAVKLGAGAVQPGGNGAASNPAGDDGNDAQGTFVPPGPNAPTSVISQVQGTAPAAVPALPPPNGGGVASVNGQPPSYFRLNPVDQVISPRFFIDNRGGGLYGYNAGYSNIGGFVPYKLDDASLFFGTGQGLITYDGRGGATLGGGWRHWFEDFDRIMGLAAFFDFDNGHVQPYQQLGFSFESLGRYTDIRINGYAPISPATHQLGSTLLNNAVLVGNGINLSRLNTIEQSYAGFDAEIGGPTPILGRYGLNAYVGGYFFMGQGAVGGNFTGVSGRLLSQINENVQFGVQVTDDALFGLNTQFQVFVTLPNGRPSRWVRNLRVQDRLTANVFRTNRVIAKEITYTSQEKAIDVNTGKPYFVANINPNSTLPGPGNGSVSNPFHSVAEYESQPLAQRQAYDLILVQPGTIATNVNLNTNSAFASTLDIFNNQRLLSTSIEHTFQTANFPGVNLTLPGFTGGTSPILFNSGGNNVVSLIGGNTQIEQVSGFQINGSSTGNGIFGSNNTAVMIDNNTIQNGLNGVLLQNMSGTIAGGNNFTFVDNTIQNNVGNGLQVVNVGTPPLEVVVQGNTFQKNGADGMRMDANSGSQIGGIIGGPNTPASGSNPAVTLGNTFDSNSGSGLDLRENAGTLTFQSTTNPAFGIVNNIFTSNGTLVIFDTNGNIVPKPNGADGLHIVATNNSTSISNVFNVINNTFGSPTDSTTGNKEYGIGLTADSGTTTINVGGGLVKNADGTTSNPFENTFNFNAISAINLAASGTATLNYSILNNSVTNGVTATTPPPHDAFSFLFNGTSGASPFTITNTSDAGISITGVTWNLAGTATTYQGGNFLTPLLQPTAASAADGLKTVDGVSVVGASNPLVINTTNNPVASATNLVTNGAPAATVATNLGLTFNNFGAGTSFAANSTMVQAGAATPLTSAAAVGTSVTVQFSNGLSSTVKLALDPAVSNEAVSASGSGFVAATPGFGTGFDGIHVAASNNSTLGTSAIEGNTVNGYGGYAIHVQTSDNANASNVVISNNTLQSNGIGVSGAGVATFTGGGIELDRAGSSILSALIDANTITSNFNNGIALNASGTATGGMIVNSFDNVVSNNAGNGLSLTTTDAAILAFNSTRDQFNGNGSTKNIEPNGADNLAMNIGGTSVATIDLSNVLANGAIGNGLSAASNDSSTLNLTVQSVNDPIFGAGAVSSFSNNGTNGILLSTNERSALNLNIVSTVVTNGTSVATAINNNGQNGIQFNRTGTGFINATITNASLSSNGVNGLFFHGLGGDPQDPNQQFSGTPNTINLIADMLNFNGSVGTGIGQGARLDLFGDSELVMNANSGTTFNSNVQNGLRIEETPGAEFGYQDGFSAGARRSIFDDVTFNNNGANGIKILSDITPTVPTPPGGNGNVYHPYDASSLTYMQISSFTGNTQINNNGNDGILMQFTGGSHDILVEGQGASGTTFTTVIQGNKGDGIHSEAGGATAPIFSGNANDGVTLTVSNALIGGPTAADANGGNGIDFESQSIMTVDPYYATGGFTWNFLGAGNGTLNVLNNSIIQNNGGNGINLIGNQLLNDTNGDRSTSVATSVWGELNLNVDHSQIIQNKGTGVNISLSGEFDSTGSFDGIQRIGTNRTNTFSITNSTIDNNGKYGVFVEQNAAIEERGGGAINPNFWVVAFNDPQPTNPPGTFNNANLAGLWYFNGATSAPTSDAFLASQWMSLYTSITSTMTMSNNSIQYNGTQTDLQHSDGVFLRIGTNTKLSANIFSNTISGNVSNDFRTESFDSYNPVTGVAPQPTGSVANTAPKLDEVVMDDAAILDLRFVNNTGNTLYITDPILNYTVGGTLLGNSSPNGAVYIPDPLKDTFSFTAPTPRIAQVFQVYQSGNSFVQNGINNNVLDAFSNADYFIRSNNTFPNPTFPLDFTMSANNPFTP